MDDLMVLMFDQPKPATREPSESDKPKETPQVIRDTPTMNVVTNQPAELQSSRPIDLDERVPMRSPFCLITSPHPRHHMWSVGNGTMCEGGEMLGPISVRMI